MSHLFIWSGRTFVLTAAIVLAMAVPTSFAAPHGGGGHGGGFGGGFHSGGFNSGGFHGGNFHNGGVHPGNFNMNGFHNGAFRGNSFHRGAFNGGFYPYYYGGYMPSYDYGYYPYSGYSTDHSYPLYPNYPDPAESMVAPSAPVDMTAHITVQLPNPEAELTINGVKTTSTGMVRNFQTPALNPGNYPYEMEAKWQESGHEVSQTQVLQVAPGAQVIVRFLPNKD